MERILEPELMEDDEQARAYAEADFEEAHNSFIVRFQELYGCEASGRVLDLGCGPGDITLRFARAYPECTMYGVDGSEAMLGQGRRILENEPEDVRERIMLIEGTLPGPALPLTGYDAVISNSLLHHLPDPQVLWRSVREFSKPNAPVFIMDLMRPASVEEAQRLVDTYAASEPDVLRRDFYNSLLAAFEKSEVEQQLTKAELSNLSVEAISDRHLVVSGRMPE